jgi:hypothetical protein
MLLSLVGIGGVWSVHAASYNSTNFSINGNLGDSAAGGQSSTSYQLTSGAGESIAGNSSSDSYKLGQGYISTLERSIQVNVQPNGLIGQWTFDQGAGGTIVDESVNATNALFAGAPTYTTGKIGQGLTGFDAIDYVLATNNSTYNVSALTSCVWMNLSATSTNPVAFARANGAFDASGMWSIGFGNGLAPRARLFAGSSATLSSPTSVTLGAWNQVCITYDGANFIMYQNGVQVQSQALTGALGSLTRDVSIGAISNGSQPFDGIVDEAKIYSRALSAAEIKAEYDAQNAGLTSGLSLNQLTPGTSQTRAFDTIVQTDSAGYTLAINQNNNLTSGANSIAPVSGSIASPVSWSEGTTKGLGFTLYGTNATGIPGTWASGASYAAIPGSSTTFYTRTGLNGGAKDIVNMRLRLDVNSSQVAGDYTNRMTITGTMTP